MDIIGRAKVVVEGDVDSSSIDRAGSRIGSKLKTGALIGAAALGTVAVAGYKSVLAFEEAESVSNKLSNVLGNMGKTGAVEAVDNLASSLQRMTGIDDELIKGGETILATFSHVAETAGVVGGTFERATRAAVDLSSAGFGSVESASVMLGKALQDPEKGITALSRAGVTFSEVQKQQIQGFIETGDVASAQNLILQEVEKQVGGTAEASAKGSTKIARGLDEVKESLGKLIVKLLGGKEGSEGLSDALFDLSESLSDMADSDAWQDLGKVLRAAGKLLEYVADTAERVKDAFKGIGDLSWSDLVPGGTPPVQFKSNPYATGSLIDLLGGRATGGPASGLTLVGERGPELVNFPNGSYVYNNNDTKEMLSGGNTNNFYVTTTGGTSDLLQELNWWGKFGPLGVANG